MLILNYKYVTVFVTDVCIFDHGYMSMFMSYFAVVMMPSASGGFVGELTPVQLSF